MKPIASLKWSNKQQPFSEVLEKYEVPNLVRVHEGHYSMNDACCFESDQLLMLHATRTKKSFLAKNSVGRRIAIPERCKSKLLVCPLSTYYGSDPIFASEMSNIYPDVKYFRVLENTSIVDKEVKRFFEPESILEVAFIDSVNSQVKFKDVEQPLSFSCRIVFEALLDYREYTLQKAARVFRLPIKVRFLPQSDEGQSADMNNDFEIMASNLGMVTICDLSKPELVVVVTELDATDLCSTLARSTVKCLQISKDCKLNVSVAKGLIKNDSDYLNMLHDFNKAFLYKYDMKGLNDFDKCYYLNDGHTIPEITASVLTSKICQSKRPGRRKSDSTVESPLGCHDYESIAYVEAPCDDDGYELVDHVNITRQSYANMEALDDAFVMSHDYMDIDEYVDMASGGDASAISHDYVNVDEYVNMTSQNRVGVTSESVITMTSPEKKCHEMSKCSANPGGSDTEIFKMKDCVDNTAQKLHPDLSVVQQNQLSKNSGEIFKCMPDTKNLSKTLSHESLKKSSQTVINNPIDIPSSIPSDVSELEPVWQRKNPANTATEKPVNDTKNGTTKPDFSGKNIVMVPKDPP